ncbi:hypothetical protein [Candidiatus Paracoxiella cheracis]
MHGYTWHSDKSKSRNQNFIFRCEVCRDARDRLLASLSIIDSQYATT